MSNTVGANNYSPLLPGKVRERIAEELTVEKLPSQSFLDSTVRSMKFGRSATSMSAIRNNINPEGAPAPCKKISSPKSFLSKVIRIPDS